jgi:hypothetical protein
MTSFSRITRKGPLEVQGGRIDNLLVGRAAYETAVRLYPQDVIRYRDGARIIARSDRGKPLA